MDTNTLLCVIEFLGAALIAVFALVIRNWASIRQSFKIAGETTRANRQQWGSILAGILGANLGYIFLSGAFTLAMCLNDPSTAETFLLPAAAAVYLFCAVPIYLPIGAVCGLLLFRLAKRRDMGSRASFILSLVVSAIIGSIVATPIYLIGLIGAAI